MTVERGVGLNGMKSIKPWLKDLIVTDGGCYWQEATHWDSAGQLELEQQRCSSTSRDGM